MQEFTYVIRDALGLHARPAGQLVKIASGFRASLSIRKNEKTGDLKRVFSVMTMGIRQGDTVTICAEGGDENDAIHSISEFMTTNV